MATSTNYCVYTESRKSSTVSGDSSWGTRNGDGGQQSLGYVLESSPQDRLMGWNVRMRQSKELNSRYTVGPEAGVKKNSVASSNGSLSGTYQFSLKTALQLGKPTAAA
ncbi:unnamed protein product [Rangifer tarandus platyrhynchus]|uniref:Uncharacterized protein n=1 Tax=Rangifer tarandus platyrhynchus TaxID=3082113 RepID=A0AC59Y7Z2_RANTA